MDRTQLTLIAAAALLFALILGWTLRWVYELLNPPPPPEPKADSEWAEYARSCEAQRDEAIARQSEIERELGGKLAQAQAELSATMDGLRDARASVRELEAELESLKAGQAG
ncbi:hypothetical protein HMH01_04375 [Halovulum dunhuangense]|uniref:Uncharacterized protein n=1 Tax=Halovulum dunhuangense TaxID=1505036 RepID=A0A849KVI1_9RHOB|nr:hypothetical protein [Halovulum dunhuangense]NNU79671.1 hypothetical protein [Halovulum dunhuangense]